MLRFIRVQFEANKVNHSHIAIQVERKEVPHYPNVFPFRERRHADCVAKIE